MMATRTIATLVALMAAACGKDFSLADAGSSSVDPTLASIRSEIFDKSCAFSGCHTGPTPAASLDLSGDGACQALVTHASCLFPQKMRVVAGKPDLSFLLDKLEGTGLDGTPAPGCASTNQRMPLGGTPLSGDKIAALQAWITSGASCGTVATDAGVDGAAIDGAGIDAASGPPGDVTAITTDVTTVLAGDRAHVTVTLSHAAPAGGQLVDVQVGDGTVLGVPSGLHIDAGASEITFDVLGKRPAHAVSVKATSGATSQSLSIAVTGLALAEVFFDPVGVDDGYEWVKISNASDADIDLSAYSFGSGRTSYTYSMTQLAGTIPAHGCFVVGGPTSDASNGSPVYGQSFNFSPDLINGSGTNGQAAGFALFDVQITQLPTSVPLDTVLCGQNNLAGLVGADGNPTTPTCPDVSPGHSVSRTAATTWVDLATPAPNACTPISL